jgi:hypothetical protein
MNPAKTKSLVGCPTIKNHRISTTAFNRRQTEQGQTYSSTNREAVSCEICDIVIQRRSMKRHLLTQHETYERPTTHNRITETINIPPRTYNISMPNGTPTDCPVPLCTGSYKTRDSMRTHFQHRHWHDTIIITEEGPLPRCNQCLMFTRTANTNKHYATQRCKQGTIRALRRQQQLEYETGTNNTILVKGVECQVEMTHQVVYDGLSPRLILQSDHEL